MEKLLNKLIEKGWKPFGDNDVIRVKYGYSVHFLCRPIVNFVLDGYAEATVPLKEILTSRSSGLWQFVCENGMLNKRRWSSRVRLETYCGGDYIEIWTGEDYDGKYDTGYEYRLIEASLKDESELEDFLLNSISLHE